jgi:hypothetical protein
MRHQKRNKKKKSNKMNFNQIPRPIALAPPKFTSQIVRSWVLRGIAFNGALSLQTITSAQLAAFMGVIATSATTSQLICDQFRLKRVCAWGPVATAGTPVTVMLKFADDPASNTQSGAPKTETDTSISYDRPAYCCLTPPKNNTSIFSQWQDSSLATAWLVVSCPQGTIFDFYFQFIVDDIGTTTAGPTLSGATLGSIYHKNIVLSSTIGIVSPLNQI